MLRLPFQDVHAQLTSVLIKLGFTPPRADACARLFAETTQDGVYSHGLNRFPRFVATIRNGSVQPSAEPACISAFGGLERWDGRSGPGNLNALAAMQRAIDLSGKHGIACVALRNTNHWMRGGTYGWQAAEAGVIGVCFTNTMPNLPPWGALDAALGNNPLILAIPRAAGPIVLDIAMSQFSYGALESYRKRGDMLPVDGGFDANGQLTRDPGAIEQTQRVLPIGYWKGSGLAMVLDTIAATLALGNATHNLIPDPFRETALSQTFIAIDPRVLGDAAELDRIADAVVASVHAARPADPHKPVRVPGEQTLKLRQENSELGLPIEPGVWNEILAM